MHTQHKLGEARRALLLTDVVDSTRISIAAGEAEMARMWAAHDGAARELLQVWNGREIDKTDGLLAVFDRAVDAAGYAIAYHRALSALGLPFKARLGVHVGTLTLRENSAAEIERGAKRFEVDGMAKPIVARVMATALGGQTLISADARDALALEALDGHGGGPGQGSAAMRIESHGHWRFKGLPEPIELFEIGDDTSPFVPPPDESKAYRVVRGETSGAAAPPALVWQPVREIKHSLPAERDSFVGRDEPLRVLADKLDSPDARLVSVLGIGGTGKTRFVTRYAWTWLGDYPGGVWFCDLAPARTLDGIYFGVAQGLDVPLGKTDPSIQLAHAIAGRGECLIIFDNFEQVAKHAEETIGRWLDRAPKAKFIVTTREVLGVIGEETLMLDPLPAADAADLFIRRARAAKHDFRVRDDDEHAAIRQLVKVLDGLPLAIELAAARVRAMTPSMLLSKMSERFDVLMSRAGRNDRQATLRAAFDWSWELLSDAEKSCMAQLSVFEGGFTLQAAEAVVAFAVSTQVPRPALLLEWLVDKSLLCRLSNDRFNMLEASREYASQRLLELERSGTMAPRETLRRHWSYFGNLDERSLTAHRCADTHNVVAACRRSIAAEQAAAACDALVGVWSALQLTGPLRTARELGAAALALDRLTRVEAATVHWVCGSAADMAGDIVAARLHFDTGLGLIDPGADNRLHARLLGALGAQWSRSGQLDQGHSALEEALATARAAKDELLTAKLLNAVAAHFHRLAQFDTAVAYCEAALHMARTLDDKRLEGGLLGNLGNIEHARGRVTEASRLYESSLNIARQCGDRRWEGNALCNLGLLHLEQGRANQALSSFEVALEIARAIGHAQLEYTVQCNVGLAHQALGADLEACHHLEAALRQAADAGDPRAEGQFRGYLAVTCARLGRMPEARLHLDRARQRLSAVGDLLSEGLLSCQAALVEVADANVTEVDIALQHAERIGVQLGVADDSDLARKIAEVKAAKDLLVATR
jgi:predicted ATPase